MKVFTNAITTEGLLTFKKLHNHGYLPVTCNKINVSKPYWSPIVHGYTVSSDTVHGYTVSSDTRVLLIRF